MKPDSILILTNCTSRKRVVPILRAGALLARSIPRGDYAAAADEWNDRIESAPRDYVANQLYCGRAITETLLAADSVKAAVAFISAGLGVVGQYDRLPAYSLTATPGFPDSISCRITDPYHPAKWWTALSNQSVLKNPLASYIENASPSLTLLAMPTGYLSMVSEDLATLPASLRRTLRIIGPRQASDVAVEFRDNLLPYDSRLDDRASGVNGTASDFPHRSLRHFATKILPGNLAGDAQAHASAVTQSLSKFRAYVRPRGDTATDEEVMVMIRKLWEKHNGRRTHILRELRSERNIACEQSRFRILANTVEERLNAAAKK